MLNTVPLWGLEPELERSLISERSRAAVQDAQRRGAKFAGSRN